MRFNYFRKITVIILLCAMTSSGHAQKITTDEQSTFSNFIRNLQLYPNNIGWLGTELFLLIKTLSNLPKELRPISGALTILSPLGISAIRDIKYAFSLPLERSRKGFLRGSCQSASGIIMFASSALDGDGATFGSSASFDEIDDSYGIYFAPIQDSSDLITTLESLSSTCSSKLRALIIHGPSKPDAPFDFWDLFKLQKKILGFRLGSDDMLELSELAAPTKRRSELSRILDETLEENAPIILRSAGLGKPQGGGNFGQAIALMSSGRKVYVSTGFTGVSNTRFYKKNGHIETRFESRLAALVFGMDFARFMFDPETKCYMATDASIPVESVPECPGDQAR